MSPLRSLLARRLQDLPHDIGYLKLEFFPDTSVCGSNASMGGFPFELPGSGRIAGYTEATSRGRPLGSEHFGGQIHFLRGVSIEIVGPRSMGSRKDLWQNRITAIDPRLSTGCFRSAPLRPLN